MARTRNCCGWPSSPRLEELCNRPRLGWTDMSQDQIASVYQQRQISRLVLPVNVSTPDEQFFRRL